MLKVFRKLARSGHTAGFSLVEVLVGGVVLIVGLVMISQFFASAAGRVLDSDIRSVLHQVATEELETIRGLPYEDVGTIEGHPTGTLAENEDRVIQNITVHINREVIYWTDSSYSGPYLANYRRVTVTVSAVDQPVDPVEMVTNVAGGAAGGTLDVTVTNLAGDPVEDAQLSIDNTHLVPAVHKHSAALKTDSLGRMIIPGLDPDGTANYFVSASLAGYNTDVTDPGVVVVDGLPFTVVHLTIDRLATMIVKVLDTNGDPVPDLSLHMFGPDGYDTYITSTDAGVTLADMRYSTDLDPYVVRLRSGQGYDAQEIKVVLDPGSTQEAVITVPAGGPTTTTISTTTTTVPSSTTTSTSTTSTSSTTTTTVKNSLRVTVKDDDWPHDALKNATVTLNTGQSAKTNSSGIVFFDNLAAGTYGVTVTKNGYEDYHGTVVVSGAKTMTVYLVAGHGGGH